MDKNDRMDKNVFVYQNSTAIGTFMKFEISYENQSEGGESVPRSHDSLRRDIFSGALALEFRRHDLREKE